MLYRLYDTIVSEAENHLPKSYFLIFNRLLSSFPHR